MRRREGGGRVGSREGGWEESGTKRGREGERDGGRERTEKRYGLR